MLEKLRQRSNEESGFTLVELLVVMLILGILAAIAVPAFFSQRDKARDADSKAAVRTAQTAIESYATDNGGSYAGADAAKLIAIEPTLSDGNLTTVTGNGTTGYTLKSTSDTANVFEITRAGGTTDLKCTTAGKGGCPPSGDWSGEVTATPPAT